MRVFREVFRTPIHIVLTNVSRRALPFFISWEPNHSAWVTVSSCSCWPARVYSIHIGSALAQAGKYNSLSCFCWEDILINDPILKQVNCHYGFIHLYTIELPRQVLVFYTVAQNLPKGYALTNKQTFYLFNWESVDLLNHSCLDVYSPSRDVAATGIPNQTAAGPIDKSRSYYPAEICRVKCNQSLDGGYW